MCTNWKTHRSGWQQQQRQQNQVNHWFNIYSKSVCFVWVSTSKSYAQNAICWSTSSYKYVKFSVFIHVQKKCSNASPQCAINLRRDSFRKANLIKNLKHLYWSNLKRVVEKWVLLMKRKTLHAVQQTLMLELWIKYGIAFRTPSFLM